MAQEYPYRRTKVKSYMKKIIDVPEVFGRIIVGVVDYVKDLEKYNNLLSSEVAEICDFVYVRVQGKKRHDYIRVFIRQKKAFLLDFIKSNGIEKKTRPGYKFQSFQDIGKAARIAMDEFYDRGENEEIENGGEGEERRVEENARENDQENEGENEEERRVEENARENDQENEGENEGEERRIEENARKNEGENVRDNEGENVSANEGENVRENEGENVSENEGQNVSENEGENELVDERDNAGENVSENEGENELVDERENAGEDEGMNVGENEGENELVKDGENTDVNEGKNVGENGKETEKAKEIETNNSERTEERIEESALGFRGFEPQDSNGEVEKKKEKTPKAGMRCTGRRG